MHFLIQTLLKLGIFANEITEKGIQHLVDALQNNTVSIFLISSILFLSALLRSDTHHTSTARQSNRRQRCTKSWRCFTKQNCKYLSLLISVCNSSHRHLRHSKSPPVVSQMKEFNIWLMVYEITW
jgi:hypothetical protein